MAAVEGYFNLGFASGGQSLESVSGLHAHGMNAGDGFSMTGGLLVPISDTKPHAFEAQIGLGLLLFSKSDDNEVNKVRWTRWPLDLIYYYRNHRNQFRIGYGLTWHVQNHLHGEGVNSKLTTDVDNSVGWVLSLEKLFTGVDGHQIVWGIRYTGIDYKVQRFSQKIEGSSILLTLGFISNQKRQKHLPEENILL